MKTPPKHLRTGDTGRVSEQRLAKSLGSKLNPGSGAVAGVKGDFIVSEDYLVEAKSTTGRAISVQHAWLGKISKEARDISKSPALALSYVTGDGRPVPNGEWVCVPMKVWLSLIQERG